MFRREHPEVVVHTMLYGSGTAAGAMLEDQADIASMAREFSPEELALIAGMSFKPVAVPVAEASFGVSDHTSAIVAYVHKDNPVQGLSLQQLGALLSQDGVEMRWGTVGVGDSRFAGCTVRVRMLDQSNGAVIFLRHRLLRDREMRMDISDQPLSPTIAHPDPCMLALGKANAPPPQSRAIAISRSSNAPFIRPTEETIMNGSYPLGRPIYLYVNRRADRPVQPPAREFLKIALSHEGQSEVEETAYHPLPPQTIGRVREQDQVGILNQ
jgi:phosphate transport system substrate-binding protein